jgi:N-acetyl-gamma-glutamylphosphate reductase
VGHAHPNLRDLDLRFSSPEDLESVDALFAATPHGVSMEQIDAFQDAADTVVDLSADFRLDSEEQYDEWYDGHTRPELLAESEYALPELNRETGDRLRFGSEALEAALLATIDRTAALLQEPEQVRRLLLGDG